MRLTAPLLSLCLLYLPAVGQTPAGAPGRGPAPDPAKLAKQAAELSDMVQHAPKIPKEKVDFNVRPPNPGFGIGYPSAVAMDRQGLIYILQRHAENNRPPAKGDADPVIVTTRDGKVVRTWGAGMFKIPHSIRVDPQGNIWTVDSGSSMIYKFTPEGKKLMEISVGEQPANARGAAGTSDIAFAPNGHLYISDGYGNARILEYSADGKRLNQWGSAGEGPGQFHQPHGVAVDDNGIVYVADRRNGRLQRFDLKGKYLGEWDNLGMVTTVVVTGGKLWIGTQQRNESPESDGWIMQIDPKSGKILGWLTSAHAHHVINVTESGMILSGARPDQIILWP
jgi:DNA-binding beta-propeller fold protein YncE